MRVLVFGASGKTGRHVVRCALEQGHRVTAFGRSVARLDPQPGLEARVGDVFAADAVADAVRDHDAVLVCLGSAGLRDRSTLATGTAHIVAAMARHGVERLVVLSAAGAGESWAQIPWSSRLAFKTLLRNLLADHEAQEAVVRESPLDWTLVRAAVLTDKPATGGVTFTATGKTTRIARADLAQALVDQLGDRSYSRQAIAVTS